jgi:hypothetical protein
MSTTKKDVMIRLRCKGRVVGQIPGIHLTMVGKSMTKNRLPRVVTNMTMRLLVAMTGRLIVGLMSGARLLMKGVELDLC